MNLAELIQATRGDRSYDALARADDQGPGPQRWQQIAVGQPLKNFPDPPTIRAMARVLRVTELRVILAAAESLGLDVHEPGSRLIALLPPDVDRLTDQQISAVRMVIQAILAGSDDEQQERPTLRLHDTREVAGVHEPPVGVAARRGASRGRAVRRKDQSD